MNPEKLEDARRLSPNSSALCMNTMPARCDGLYLDSPAIIIVSITIDLYTLFFRLLSHLTL